MPAVNQSIFSSDFKDEPYWWQAFRPQAIIAPALISWSSRPPRRQRLSQVFRTDSEIAPPPVVAEYHAITAAWSGHDLAPETATIRTPSYVPA